MSSVQAYNNPGADENVIGMLWAKYFPYWPFYLLLLILSLAGTWLFLQRATPLYEATATLLIKDEKKGIDDSRMIESLNLLSTKKTVENELEVLGSRSLMEDVVKNLSLYAPVYREGKWRPISAYSSSPIKIEVQDPAAIIENPKIDFNYNESNQTVRIGSNDYPLNQWVTTSYAVLKFTPVHPKTKLPGNQFFFSLINPKRVVGGLMKQLDAAASNKLSTVINLKMKDEDPFLAEDMLNQLIFAYNKAAVNDKNTLAENTLAFVQERLDVVGHHLDSIEQRIQQYKSNKGAVDISSQGKLFLENVSINDQKVGEINTQLAALEQVEKYVSSKDQAGGIVPSIPGDPNSLLSTLLKRLYDAELEKEKMKKTTGENSPTMIALTDQIEKIKPSILENIQSQRKSLEVAKQNLSSTSNSYSSLLQSIPQKERDLVEISRQQNIENNIYAFLLQKREEASLSNSSTVADNRLVDKAQASLLPVSPNKKLFYLIAAFLALGLGVLLITVKDLFNNKILYRTEIENFTNVPVIGELSFTKSKDFFVIAESGTTQIAEEFRKLRASLKFIKIGDNNKKILVTSTGTDDGKSFVTANLALTLALSGKKVVIVDADLYNASLSRKFEISEERGLSTYLTGEHTAEQVIAETPINKNLFLIATGLLPPNSSELLINGKMEVLLNHLANSFDYILVDTAPVAAIADAYSLSPACDATLYIVRHAHTPKIAIKRLDKTNKINELKNIAIVFNGVKSKSFVNGAYGYGYGYGKNYLNGKKANSVKKRKKWEV